MKKMFFSVLILCLFIFPTAYATRDTSMQTRLAQTASGRNGEYVTELSEGWKFGGNNEDASEEDYIDSAWPRVNLPHTWNRQDAADGDGNYQRTSYWYRKTVDFDESIEGKQIYLEFLGANQKIDVYVNGQHIRLSGSDEYTHKGGYTAFRYNMTDALRIGGNTIAVKVDNSYSEEIAPIGGDFNMYGGIYRRVYLVSVDDVHIDLSNGGSSGLFLTTPHIRSKERPQDLGTLNIRADIVNEGSESKTVTVTAHIEGDNAPEDIARSFTIAPGGTARFDETEWIRDPHLWKGIDFSGSSDNSDVGYRYAVTLTVSAGEKTLDAVSDMVGFRYFYLDKETGFYLNGESHPLRGVNRHQFKEGMGNAIIEADHKLDMQLILELGANAVRLSHYPQTDYFYDLCDENGIILWTEIPLVKSIGKDENFLETTKNQLSEMIRQQYNRPSICFWGIQNEVREETPRSSYYSAKQVMTHLDALAHEEDSTGRYTAQAINHDLVMDENDPSRLDDYDDMKGWKSDLVAWNIYPGWYSSFQGTIESQTEEKTSRDSRPMGLSEYGWGASVSQHELYPELGKRDLTPFGKWHPEEYQSLMHEEAVKYINTHDKLWAAFIWCMFDFDVDTRSEGSRTGQNDKGLVTNDRTIKKDSFFLYKANWDRRAPFVHITSSRYSKRESAKTYVKVYSNCDSVTLYINGDLIGPMDNMGNGVFLLENVNLSVGENKLRAEGSMGDLTCDDSCLWNRIAASAALLQSDVLPVSQENNTITLSKPMTVAQARQALTAVDGGTFRVMLGDEEVKDKNAFVVAGMKAVVRSENNEKEKTYSFIRANLFEGKRVWATSSEDNNVPENAIDDDVNTRWVAADNTYPQSIQFDLGKTYRLGMLTINWFTKNDRYYTYTVEISEDGIHYDQVVDRSENTVPGKLTHDLRLERGRYVNVNVLSCSDSKGYAAIHDMQLDGIFYSLGDYETDEANKLILVSDPAETDLDQLLDILAECEGICAALDFPEGEDTCQGARVRIADINGREFVYTITTRDQAYLYSSDVALLKPVFFSSEEGSAGKAKLGTYARNVNDGLVTTAWAAAQHKSGKESIALYPEWIGVDLGMEYNIEEIELRFETKRHRIYQYQVYGACDSPFTQAKDFPSGYELMVQQLENADFQDGHYILKAEGKKARYVVVVVCGNDILASYPHAAAGIYDFRVYGTSYTAEQTEQK